MAQKLSIVMTTRNDNYGGALIHRTYVCLSSLLEQSKQYHLPIELLIVEWNPPDNEKRLTEVFPILKDFTDMRLITVSNALHRQFPNSDKTPMFEYMAKNVGIRRSIGEYILVTNPDILFSDELMRFIASEHLSPDAFYRVDRYDVSEPVPWHNITIGERLKLCGKYTRQINTLGFSVALNERGPLKLRAKCAMLNHRLQQLKKGQIRKTTRVEDKIHTNGSGDFMLMHRNIWHSLRGYVELSTMSHIDSYLCVLAVSAGVRQVILPSRMHIYHQEHDRSVQSKRPMTSYETWRQESEQMLKEHKPLIVNDDDWGLADLI